MVPQSPHFGSASMLAVLAKSMSQSGKIWDRETSLRVVKYGLVRLVLLTFVRLVSVKVENQFLRLVS